MGTVIKDSLSSEAAKINRTDLGEPVRSVETRKRDLVIRIADWTRDKDEPAYDVEVYNKGVYDWNESRGFRTRNAGRTKAEARRLAIEFACQQVASLLS